MKNLSRLILSVMLAISFLFGSQVMANERYGKQKVAYHINYDDPKKQIGTLRNIQNHIDAVGVENIEMKVVLHGDGLSLLLLPASLEKLSKFKQANANDQMTATIDGLRSQGVVFSVCNNTVKGRDVNVEDDLHNVEESDIVPSGVAELAHLQGQGYAYMRP